MGRKERSETEWREIIAEQRKSGLSQCAWCEANGIKYATFIKRVLVLRKKDRKTLSGEANAAAACEAPLRADEQKTGWVELGLPQPDRKASLTPPPELFGIKIGKFRLIVPNGFDEAALKRICKALGELC